MPLLLNQLQASSVRRFTSWKGPWFADVDVVLDETGIMPQGPCVMTVGGAVPVPMRGTIDPRASGAFAKSGKARVIAGGAGWDKLVLPLPFSNPAGVLSTAVYAATAAEVLETVLDVVPSVLGSTAYLRSAGPASRVFGNKDWYVSPLGVTTVGPRLPLPYDPTSTEILSFDPLTRVAELSSDAPIEPGTILLDPLRFDGPLIVHDVEQTWGAAGARATCWCKPPVTIPNPLAEPGRKGSRLGAALAALVGEAAGVAYLKTYEYRVVLEDGTKALILQIVDPTLGIPNALPIDMWMGVPGMTAQVLPGLLVLVTFANGDPGHPYVVAFKANPLGALQLTIGLGLAPLALATGTQAQIAALQTEIAAVAAALVAVTGISPLLPAHATAAAAATAAVTSGATTVAAGVVPATSVRVVSD